MEHEDAEWLAQKLYDAAAVGTSDGYDVALAYARGGRKGVESV